MNEEEEVITLPSKIISFCDLLTAHRGKIQRVEKYLLRIAGDPVEHDGIISTTAHSLAWSFAHRLWLASFNVLCEQAAIEGEWYEGGDDFHLDRDRLLANWKKIQLRLRTMKPIDDRRFCQVVRIESAKAADVLDPNPSQPLSDGDDPDPIADDAAYQPKTEAMKTFGFGGNREFNSFISDHRIRTRQPISPGTGEPHPRRLVVHVGDIMAALRANKDPLDLPAEVVDRAVQEAAQRKAEVDGWRQK